MDFTTIIYYIQQYGYIGLFGLFILGLVGLPIPDEVILAFVGFLSYQGKMNYFLTLLAAGAGSVVGMSFSYWLGNKLGKAFFKKHGKKVNLSMNHIERVEEWFLQHEGLIIIVGYFIPGVRHVTSIVSGILKYSYRKFIVYTVAGATIWVGTFVSIGYLLGENWKVFIQTLQRQLHIWLILSVIFIGLLVFLWDKFKKIKHK